MAENLAIIAAAGSLKTETVIERALEDPGQKVLITTYTRENLAQIIRRIEDRVSVVPANVSVMTWFSFLISQAVRPYQCAVLDCVGFARGLNFQGKRQKSAKKAEPERYFFDSNHDIYRDGVSDFACLADECAGGSVISRLEQRFSRIYIDEVQDLVGYDLEFLDLLFKSKIAVTVVGDPRQHTFSTNTSMKNKKYQGPGFLDWLKERTDNCSCEERATSARCSQEICDFASTIFPEFDPLIATRESRHGQDGIHIVDPGDLESYVAKYRPKVLRHQRNVNTRGLEAINIGVSKGCTYDRVLIFPTKPMRTFLEDGDPSKLKAPEKLYVAVTRACHGVAFVV